MTCALAAKVVVVLSESSSKPVERGKLDGMTLSSSTSGRAESKVPSKALANKELVKSWKRA